MSERWWRIRMVLYALGVLAGLIVPFLPATDEAGLPFHELPIWLNIALGVVLLAAVPLGLLFVIGIQAINPFSDRYWERPTHRHNFLRLGNPLLFFHFGAWWALCIHGGIAAMGLVVDWRVGLEGLLGMILSAWFLLGVKWAAVVFSSKVVEPGAKPEPASTSN